ncbi:hypothetical protein [Hyalangium rubrum]|uniref:Lipoprotein n=1 Tax=Hyalangium rubrum TaxID=3103134 RepID=A0ABU5H4Q8_9BACT|nr:hypothetical protein [Hyalangium sp. s54d21]MDY7227803.1 hypothetical protein [Hyalangium sp. s54d21]
MPAAARLAATLGTRAAGARHVVDAALKGRLEAALKECADDARASVLVEHMNGRSPTYEECTETLMTRPDGQPVTRAMWLGEQMHRVALRCVEEKLNAFMSGRFSLEPRYWHNPKTRQLEWLSPEEVKALLQQGRGAELRGSIQPDLVIHLGDPLHAQGIYDFKFACMHNGKADWREYPEGHPYEFSSQKEVYEELLRARAFRVMPHWGILP